MFLGRFSSLLRDVSSGLSCKITILFAKKATNTHPAYPNNSVLSTFNFSASHVMYRISYSDSDDLKLFVIIFEPRAGCDDNTLKLQSFFSVDLFVSKYGKKQC